jgi:hypothetical protein
VSLVPINVMDFRLIVIKKISKVYPTETRFSSEYYQRYYENPFPSKTVFPNVKSYHPRLLILASLPHFPHPFTLFHLQTHHPIHTQAYLSPLPRGINPISPDTPTNPRFHLRRSTRASALQSRRPPDSGLVSATLPEQGTGFTDSVTICIFRRLILFIACVFGMINLRHRL